MVRITESKGIKITDEMFREYCNNNQYTLSENSDKFRRNMAAIIADAIIREER